MRLLNLGAVLLMLVISSVSQAAGQANINLTAIVPDVCSLTVMGSIDPAAIGESAMNKSGKRFSVPVQVDCNTPNARLRALPRPLSSPTAPGYEIYYHVNTSKGLEQQKGWISTENEDLLEVAHFIEPTQEQIEFYIENFGESSQRMLPAGTYNGLILLSIGAQ